MILVRLLFLGLLVLGVLLAASGLLVATSGDPIGVLILLPGLVAAAIGWHFAKKYDDENSEELGAVRPPTHNNHEEHLKAGVIIDTDCKTCSEALQNTPHHHEAHLRAGVIYEEGCGVCGREAVERRRVVSQARQPVAPSRRYAPGQSIGGEYKVLGVRPGGMGVVYVVQPRPPRGACVLKTYHQVGDPRIGAAFRREAEAWIRIPPHPNVVGAASVEVLDSTLFGYVSETTCTSGRCLSIASPD
jgi:hypothetical protein